MNLAGRLDVLAEIRAVFKGADGRVVDLGVITSPYTDRPRNWIWKKGKEHEIRRVLGRTNPMDRYLGWALRLLWRLIDKPEEDRKA